MLKGTRKMKRFLCVLLTAIMIFGGFPGGISQVHAENHEEDLDHASDIFALEQNEPAELSSYPDNVYNVKKNEAFLLVEKNELAMIVSHPNSEASEVLLMDEFDFGLKKRDEDGNSFIYNPNPANARTTKSLEDPYFQIEYVQSIGLDMEGTGRKQYIASIGWASDSQVIFEYQNATANKYGGLTLSIDASEAYATKNWAKDNVLAITAGDYDRDGKDSAIVYICGNGDGAKLYEFYFDSNNALKYREIFNFSQVLKDKNYISKTGYEYKPSVSLTTGDFNGDGQDQLAFSAGFCNTSDSKKHGFVDYACNDLRQFANCVGILDWNGSAFELADVEWMVDQSTSYSLSGNTKTYPLTIMHVGALTAGDVNNDGVDEIVVAGYMSWTKDQDSDDYARAIYKVTDSKETLASVSYVCDYSDNYWASAVIYCDENTYKRTQLTPFEMVKAHQYTFEEYCNNEDWVFAKLSMASAKVNGDNAPELIFISGGLYDFQNQFLPSPKYTPSYLAQNCAQLLCGQLPCSVNFVRNVAVGNFDGNEAGREQFVYTLWQKTKGQDSYSSYTGVIAGVEYNDTYDSSQNPTNLGEAKAYACNDQQILIVSIEQFTFVSGTAEEGSVIHCMMPGSAVLNAVPVALDTDNDGVLARYHQHGYVYTDPEVLAVLQAGPYFAEIMEAGGYEGTCETEYAFSKTVGNSTLDEDEVGFEVGVAAEANAGPLKVSLEAGYSMNWSHTYEESYSVTKETSFQAYSEDVVVISRVPELIYTYDIWDPSIRDWIENGMHVRVPLTPCYFTLSVDEYNAFVDEYNEIVGVDSPLGLNKIQKGVDLPLDYHGNPGQYWSSWDAAGSGSQKLSAGTYALGYTSSSSQSTYSTESASSESQGTSHGFHFGLTVQVGGDYLCGEAWAGGYTNLDYSHSTGYSETKVNTVGSHGKVINIRASAVQGLTYSQVENGYRFKWEFGTWTRRLMKTGDKVPFYGYTVFEVTRRAQPPQLNDVSGSIAEGYSAFTVPNLTSGLNSVLTVTKVSGDSRITYDKSINGIKVAAGLAKGTYTAVFKISNGLESLDTTFKYTLKVVDSSSAPNTKASLKAASLTFEGQIAINYKLSDLEKGWTVKLNFEQDNGTFKTVSTTKIDANTPKDSSGRYVFAYTDVAAKQMTRKLRIEIVDANGKTVLFHLGSREDLIDHYDYAVVDWAENKIIKSTDENEVEFAKAILMYGGTAQDYFGYNLSNYANPERYMIVEKNGVTASDLRKFAAEVPAKAKNAGLKAASLSFESATEINVKFSKNVSVKIDGKDVTLSNADSSTWVTTIKNIPAKKLHEMHTIELGKVTAKYGALSWASSKIGKTDTEKAAKDDDIARALYLFNRYARVYFDYDTAGLN